MGQLINPVSDQSQVLDVSLTSSVIHYIAKSVWTLTVVSKGYSCGVNRGYALLSFL